MAIAVDHHQQVIEIVRHPPRQAADRFHPLDLNQVRFGLQFLSQPQRFLGLFQHRDIADDHARYRRHGVFAGHHRLHLRPERRGVFSQHAQLEHLRRAGFHQPFAGAVVNVLIFGGDKAGQRLFQQRRFGGPEQAGAGQIGLQDQPVFGERQIADRRQVEQIEIAGPRRFQLLLGAAQFLILHLQFNLVNLEFVQRLADGLGRQRHRAFRNRGVTGAGQPFGPVAQRLQCGIRQSRVCRFSRLVTRSPGGWASASHGHDPFR